MSDRQNLFSDLDKAFILSHPLGRLATITSDGSPTVVPVTAELRADLTLAVTGFQVTRSVKWHNLARDPRFAYVLDEGIGESAAGLLVRGRASLVEDRELIVLLPDHLVSWGIESHPFTRISRHLMPS